MSPPIRVGVIGAGFGAKVHVPAFRRDPRFEVVAFSSSNPERARATADAAKIPKSFAHWQDIVADEAVDLVSVAVPPAAQPELLFAAIAAKKHVFAEKPVGGGAAVAEKLAAAANAEGIRHAIDFEFPEIDAFQRARSLVAEGRIGRVRHASVAWHIESYAHKHRAFDTWKTSSSAGAGVLNLFLSHTLQYVEWLLEKPITALTGRLATDPSAREDSADEVVHLSLACGDVPVSIAASSCSRAGSGHRIEIHGDEGAVVLENTNADYVNGFELSLLDAPGHAAERFTSSFRPESGQDGRVSAVAALLRRFADAILQHTRFEPNLDDGARIEAWLEHARAGSGQ
jgi:predicted dehydrogenase